MSQGTQEQYYEQLFVHYEMPRCLTENLISPHCPPPKNDKINKQSTTS